MYAPVLLEPQIKNKASASFLNVCCCAFFMFNLWDPAENSCVIFVSVCKDINEIYEVNK